MGFRRGAGFGRGADGRVGGAHGHFTRPLIDVAALAQAPISARLLPLASEGTVARHLLSSMVMLIVATLGCQLSPSIRLPSLSLHFIVRNEHFNQIGLAPLQIL